MSEPQELELDALVDRAGAVGRVSVQELQQYADALDLGDEARTRLAERLAEDGVELVDDERPEAGDRLAYGNEELAWSTVEALQLFFDELRGHRLPTPAQEIELARRVESGDTGAKQQMITANLRLIVPIVRRYQDRGLPLLDLIQEGILGLIGAVEKFDWRDGYAFSAYAAWWIRQAALRGLAKRARTIRLPVDVAERQRALARTHEGWLTEFGRPATDFELATRAGLSPHDVRVLGQAARTVVSLEQRVDSADAHGGELLPTAGAEPAKEIEVDLDDGALRRAVANLPDEERRVIELRYGIGDDPHALAETERLLGLPRGEIIALEEQALERLAREREIQALGEYA